LWGSLELKPIGVKKHRKKIKVKEGGMAIKDQTKKGEKAIKTETQKR
jgi:hypothetical protein